MSEATVVPTLRFPEFNTEWEERRICDLTRFYDGTHQTPNYASEGVAFFSVEHITSNNFTDTKLVSREVFNKENQRVKVERGDILMTRIGDVGTARYIDWDVEASFYVSLALIKQADNFSSKFLAHAIGTEQFQRELWKRTIHVAFPRKINLGEIGNCPAKLPTLPEQQKIADFLGAVDARVGLLRRRRDALRAYKKGMMQRLFSQELRFTKPDGSPFTDWQEKRLGEVSETVTGSSNREDSTEQGDYVFFDRSSDVRASARFLFDCEAIIVAGEGKDFPPRHFVGKFDLHQRTYATMNFGNNSGRFLFYWIDWHRAHFLKHSVGSTMPSLRMGSFSHFPVSLPHPEEQQKIADTLTALDAKIDAVTAQMDAMLRFKKGLLQQMFV